MNLVIETLGSLLVQEINLLGSTNQEVQSIKNELESIRSFLKDADAREAAEQEEGESNEGVKTWVKQVREEAFRIEDVIDEYILKEAKLARGSGLTYHLRKFFCFINVLKLHHGIASKIEVIKSSLADIQRRERHYSFRSIEQGSVSRTRNVISHDPRVGSLFIEDDEVVGIESARDLLIGWLVNGRKQRSVVALVGQGGIGKTTLAGKLFNNQYVMNHFDCRAWITVGRECMKKDLLIKMIKEFHQLTGQSALGEMNNMEEKDLIIALRQYLHDKNYMIVLDDVWKIELWGDVEHALLDNKKGSRIMLTTRYKAVADFCKQSSFVQVHELEALPAVEAWRLFCRKAFASVSDGGCPPELEKLSHEIVAKCGGLPLAIVAVGGLLSTKHESVSEWRRSLEGLGSKLGSNPHLKICSRVLSEGFHDLPHHLKSCLLYFGLFPQGYSINCERLIRLWIAEGFVPYSTRPPSEQIGEEYLTELIDRSLVHVCKRARSCRVHDLMHEIILEKTKDLGFCLDLSREDLSCCTKTRRISINQSLNNVLEWTEDSKIRSVFFLNVDKLPGSFMTKLVAEFKLMKVLDFEDAPIEFLPEGVGNLFHLHYLSVRNTKVKVLPKSIGRLLNLQTLDLKHSLVTQLPVEIKNLKKLRCLVVYHNDNGIRRRGIKIQVGFGSLTDLQRLYIVQANSKILNELRKLRQLRKLGIQLTNEDGKNLCASIADMENLESLTVESTSREEAFDIQSLGSPPQYLQRLYLSGSMKNLPDWIFKLKNLVRIGLYWSELTNDPMNALQALPNLLELRLRDAYGYEKLHFKDGWFPRLQRLILLDLKGVTLMMIDKGAMPCLRELKIGPCPLLKEIPAGIEHLRNLEILKFCGMLTVIASMIDDANWQKIIELVPCVFVSFKRAGKNVYKPAKFLSSLSPEDLQHFMEEVSPSNHQ